MTGWSIGKLVTLCGLFFSISGTVFAQSTPIVPHGWTGYQSKNGMYLKRPDLPGVVVYLYGDSRPNLDLKSTFKTFKQGIANRHECPGLASAETILGFGSMGAASPGKYPKCELIAMGLPNGGIQVGLILDADNRIRSNKETRDAIKIDIVELFLVRAGMMKTGKQPVLTALVYAKLIPSENKPIRMVHYTSPMYEPGTQIRSTAKGSDDLGPRIGDYHHSLLLFKPANAKGFSWASRCSDWDPSFYSPVAMFPYHVQNKCFPVLWRWQAGQVDGNVEVQPLGEDWMTASAYFESLGLPGRVKSPKPFRRFKRGERFDLMLGGDRDLLKKVKVFDLPRSALGRTDIIFMKNGRFVAGDLKSSVLGNTWISCDGSSCRTPDPEPMTGSYFFDGYTITLKLDSGTVVHGFTAWLASDLGEENIGPASNLVINSVLYRSNCVGEGGECAFAK